MTLSEVCAYFQADFPDANLVKLPKYNPTEIICEIDPTSDHPGYSIALSALSATAPHKHLQAVEEYEVIHGTILIKVGDSVKTLYEREKISIPVETVHSATSVEGFALVKVTSQPGWTPEDHLPA